VFISCRLDINECDTVSTGENVCPSETARCINEIGSYQCVCLPGYVKDIISVRTRRTCFTHEWTYRKHCQLFCLSKNTRACVDVDECTNRTDDCAKYSNAYCVNIQPFFECRCNYGYAPNGTTTNHDIQLLNSLDFHWIRCRKIIFRRSKCHLWSIEG
jgi:hypothetical protein